eukprot:2584043-Rhodomonas_salina.5
MVLQLLDCGTSVPSISEPDPANGNLFIATLRVQVCAPLRPCDPPVCDPSRKLTTLQLATLRDLATFGVSQFPENTRTRP